MKLLAATVLSLSLVASASGQTITIARSGSQPSRPGPAENFTGSVRVDPWFQATAPARTTGALATFEPGARSAWHTHPLGQTLIGWKRSVRSNTTCQSVDENRQPANRRILNER